MFINLSKEQFAFSAAILLVWHFFTYFGVIVQAGGLICWFILLISLLECILKMCRAFAWRVVEHNKGAYAALTLVVTICFGILKLLLSGSA